MNNLPALDNIQTEKINVEAIVKVYNNALEKDKKAFRQHLSQGQKIFREMDRIGELRGEVEERAKSWSRLHNRICLIEVKAFESQQGKQLCAKVVQSAEYNRKRRNRGFLKKVRNDQHLNEVEDIICQQRSVSIVTLPMIGEFFKSQAKNYLIVSTNTKNENYFTPERIILPIRQALGGHIDLDPASCLEANKVVQASEIYTEEQNGLVLPWNKGTLFLNPPYTHGILAQFVDKFCEEDFKAGIILVNSTLETIWGQKLQQHSNAVCFPKGRIQFYFGEKVYTGNTRGQAIFGRRVDTKLFKKAFKDIGQCWVK